MGVVEADQPRAIRCVQRERVGQAVRPLTACFDTLDLELDPVAFFEVMNTPIEGK
jgi:hypothetical protein